MINGCMADMIFFISISLMLFFFGQKSLSYSCQHTLSEAYLIYVVEYRLFNDNRKSMVNTMMSFTALRLVN